MGITIGKTSGRVYDNGKSYAFGYTGKKPVINLKVITWIGTITQIFGAFLVASSIFFVGYVFFAIGAICWLTFAYRTSNNALMLLECVFLSSNFLGLYNFF